MKIKIDGGGRVKAEHGKAVAEVIADECGLLLSLRVGRARFEVTVLGDCAGLVEVYALTGQLYAGQRYAALHLLTRRGHRQWGHTPIDPPMQDAPGGEIGLGPLALLRWGWEP